VIASGGAGKPEHVAEVFTKTGASAAIISSMLYSPRMDRNYSVKEIKDKLVEYKIPVRPWIENYNI
jgi:cyclase